MTTCGAFDRETDDRFIFLVASGSFQNWWCHVLISDSTQLVKFRNNLLLLNLFWRCIRVKRVYQQQSTSPLFFSKVCMKDAAHTIIQNDFQKLHFPRWDLEKRWMTQGQTQENRQITDCWFADYLSSRCRFLWSKTQGASRVTLEGWATALP